MLRWRALGLTPGMCECSTFGLFISCYHLTTFKVLVKLCSSQLELSCALCIGYWDSNGSTSVTQDPCYLHSYSSWAALFAIHSKFSATLLALFKILRRTLLMSTILSRTICSVQNHQPRYLHYLHYLIIPPCTVHNGSDQLDIHLEISASYKSGLRPAKRIFCLTCHRKTEMFTRSEGTFPCHRFPKWPQEISRQSSSGVAEPTGF